MINRREFVGGAAAVTGALMGAPILAEEAQKPPVRLTEKATLGKTGIVSSLLGIGTGSNGWNHVSNQTRIGQEAFTRLIRHAYDSGITFFDCADMYGSHPFLREAIKGIPRDKFVIQTKIVHRTATNARADLDRFRKELGVDYMDIVLMHVVTEKDWNGRYREVQDVLEEARQKGVIRAHGCSCHTFEALETAAADPWVQVDLARFNPWGASMDVRRGTTEDKAPELVKPVLQRMRKAGKAVIGMKVLGGGGMAQGADRLARIRESVKFSLASGAVDMMIVGLESPQQVTELLSETKVAMAEIGWKAA